jgi:hypothetical protein
MIKLKKILLIILIFILSSFCSLEIYARRNPNIARAESLIKERQFKDAKSILLIEFANDPENEDLIIGLLDKIDAEEGKIGDKSNAAISSLKKNDTEKAEDFLKEIQNKLKGEYNKKVTDIVTSSEVLNEKVKKVNAFYKMIYEAEEMVINYKLEDGVKKYKEALDIFRITNENPDKNFVKFGERFVESENKLLNFGVDKKFFDASVDISVDAVLKNYNALDTQSKDYIKFEDELISVRKELNTTDSETKKTVDYQAYDFILNAYIQVLRRNIQKNGLIVVNETFKLLENEFKNEKIANFTNIDKLLDLITNKKLEYYSFYNFLVNYNLNVLMKRSSKNFYTYIDYLNNKNVYILRTNLAKVKNSYSETVAIYNSYEKKLENREMRSAEEDLNKANKKLPGLNTSTEELDSLFKPFEKAADSKNFKNVFDEYKDLTDKIVKVDTEIKDASQYVENTTNLLRKLYDEANEKYNSALASYKKNNYDDAAKDFEEVDNKFYEILSKVKDKDIESKIDSVDKYLKEIKNRLYERDIGIAENNIENAKKNFYNEKYEDANKSILVAESIYTKYDETSDAIVYYKDRIMSALKLRSGTKLSIDDPVYDNITELFKNSNDAYEKKDFQKALAYLNQILLEKPYNEEARFLETKILKETDPVNFERKFQQYYDKAKEVLAKARNSGSKTDFGNALVELEQLKIFKKDENVINNLIAECKKNLEFTKKDLTQTDKNYAVSLVNKAKNFYQNGKFAEALDAVNEAIKIWEDVPEARNTRLASMQKLKISQPQLTKDNELKFRLAEKAYSENDFKKAYQITGEIMKEKGQNIDKVLRLNRKAEIKQQS